MADSNFTASTENTTELAEERTFYFPAGGVLYQLHEDATKLNIQDQLDAKLKHLHTSLSLIVGDGFDHFHDYPESFQQNYLWGCSMMAEECKELAAHL